MSTGPMDCNELVELVTAYLDGALDPDTRARFDSHLVDCDGCENYLQQFRETVRTVGKITDDEFEHMKLHTTIGAETLASAAKEHPEATELLPPKDLDDPLYSARHRAYQEQRVAPQLVLLADLLDLVEPAAQDPAAQDPAAAAAQNPAAAQDPHAAHTAAGAQGHMNQAEILRHIEAIEAILNVNDPTATAGTTGTTPPTTAPPATPPTPPADSRTRPPVPSSREWRVRRPDPRSESETTSGLHRCGPSGEYPGNCHS